MGMRAVIDFDEETLEAIEKFTELAVRTYKAGEARKNEVAEIKALACIALQGILKENPDTFRYKKDMRSVRDNVEILVEGRIQKAYIE
jgi:hypothetical protein